MPWTSGRCRWAGNRFRNLNDGTNGGMRYWELPFVSVQFDPEAAPGPVDTTFLAEEFIVTIDGC